MIVVVGRGLVGCATARHLAEAGRAVLLVGPPEEADPRTARAFASHHDRARVVRQLGHDAHWTALNRRAIAGMEALQAKTGRRFRSYEGCLYTSHLPDDPHIASALVEAETLGLPAERLDPEEVPRRFPDLAVPKVVWVLWAVFMVVGFSNAVNLTDGLDGLAGGSAAMGFGAFIIVVVRHAPDGTHGRGGQEEADDVRPRVQAEGGARGA